MKNKERIIFISVITVLLVFIASQLFIKQVNAGTLSYPFPYMNRFVAVFNSIKSDYVDADKLDDKKIIDGAIDGMLKAIGDPYTQFLNEDDMNEMKTTSSGTFGGVGMIITEKDGYIGVVSPIEGTPAYKKGMKAGDLIISVEGESLKGVSVNDAAKKLKGIPGTPVKIEFIRNEIKYEVELIRALIDVPTVKHDIIREKIGYLRITQFSGTTDKHVKDALIDFKNKNVKGIIVDLRANPGGLLDKVITIVDYFQNDGIIVSTKGRRMNEETVNKSSKFTTIVPEDIPVIVLVDNGSASASEIFSGAIKDNKRGILLGEKTFGKGSVQTIQLLGEGKDGFKITIAKYYTPSGVCIHDIGIMPDVEVKEPELTDEEKEGLKKIFKDKIIDNFLKTKSLPSDVEIDSFIEKSNKSGYVLNKRYFKKLIKNGLEYGNEKAPIYDLDYDIQLNKALEILENGKLINNGNGKFSIKK